MTASPVFCVLQTFNTGINKICVKVENIADY